MNQEKQPLGLPPELPVRLERYEAAPPSARRRFWLHPMSGLLVLGVDWILFAPEAATAEVAAIVTSPFAFVIVTTGVYLIQRRRNGDARGAALLKALLGGFLAAVPTPITGTVFGTLVLVLSGLSNWNRDK